MPSLPEVRILAIYPIAHRQNSIKIIKLGCVLLFAVITHVFQNGTCAVSVEFSTVVDIIQVFRDSRSFCPEKDGYLFLR